MDEALHVENAPIHCNRSVTDICVPVAPFPAQEPTRKETLWTALWQTMNQAVQMSPRALQPLQGLCSHSTKRLTWKRSSKPSLSGHNAHHFVTSWSKWRLESTHDGEQHDVRTPFRRHTRASDSNPGRRDSHDEALPCILEQTDQRVPMALPKRLITNEEPGLQVEYVSVHVDDEIASN